MDSLAFRQQVAILHATMRISAHHHHDRAPASKRTRMKYTISYALFLAASAAAIASPAAAADRTATIVRTTQDGAAESLGTVTIASSPAGATFRLALHGLPPGPHGFHVHENGACGPALANNVRVPGGAAGGHLDPAHTGKHEGPIGTGHLGDLPVLDVQPDGTANQTLTAPRLKDVDALKGRALMIHVGGDNYADTPAQLGGGGARFACGVIE
jgi:superoxide dismutase, Cu-Zn family